MQALKDLLDCDEVTKLVDAWLSISCRSCQTDGKVGGHESQVSVNKSIIEKRKYVSVATRGPVSM